VIGIHHLLYFTFIFFNWDGIYLILKNSLFTSLFSLILVALLSSLYTKLNDS
jgi:hypothetical protein